MPLPAVRPQPAQALLALVADAQEIGGPAHPAIPSGSTLQPAWIWAFELPFLQGWEEGGSQDEFEQQPVWVSPWRQEAGRCWAEERGVP